MTTGVCERILEGAGEIARFLLAHIAAADLGAAAVDRPFLHARRGNDFAVEHDGHLRLLLEDLFGQFAEFLTAFGVEIQMHAPAARVVESPGAGHRVAEQIGLLFDEQLRLDRLAVALHAHRQDHKPDRRHFFAGLDLGNQAGAVAMHEAELQLRHLLQLLPRFGDLLLIDARDLHEDPRIPLRRDDRLADAKLIDALANRLHRLVHHVRRDEALPALLVQRRVEADEEGRAPLQIEPEVNPALADDLARRVLDVKRRVHHPEAERREHHREHGAQDALGALALGKKVPAEEAQQQQAKEEDGDVRVHEMKLAGRISRRSRGHPRTSRC